jgi:hypothetical protein
MFESGYLDTGSASARESKIFVTVAVLAIVFASIAYFLVVFSFELIVELGGKEVCCGKAKEMTRLPKETALSSLPANRNPMFKAQSTSPKHPDPVAAAIAAAADEAVPDPPSWKTFREQFAAQHAEIVSLKELRQRQEAAASTSARQAGISKKVRVDFSEDNRTKKAKHSLDSPLYKASNSRLALARLGSKTKSSPAIVSEKQRQQQEASLGILNMGATDSAGKPLATGWVRKQMGDKTWFENDTLGKKAWSPVY